MDKQHKNILHACLYFIRILISFMLLSDGPSRERVTGLFLILAHLRSIFWLTILEARILRIWGKFILLFVLRRWWLGHNRVTSVIGTWRRLFTYKRSESIFIYTLVLLLFVICCGCDSCENRWLVSRVLVSRVNSSRSMGIVHIYIKFKY